EVLADAADRVNHVPIEVGDWKAEPVEADSAAFAQAGAERYWMRTYVDARRQTSLLVILMCGRAGRMAVHTPEVCYRGAGYDMLDDPAALSVTDERGGELGTFWSARFVKG